MYMSSEKDENNTSKLVCAEAVHEFRTKHQAKFTQVLNLSTISEEKSSKKDVLCWCSGCFLVDGRPFAPQLLSSATPFAATRCRLLRTRNGAGQRVLRSLFATAMEGVTTGEAEEAGK
jgi:hypothetical protein